MRTPFKDRLAGRPLLFDGAMGTMLYARGVFVNRCYDELCLSQPDLVTAVHADYVAAGADVIETNSFGANAIRLKGFGLADKVTEINLAAARLARTAAGKDLYVAGSVGPCLEAGQPWNEDAAEDLSRAFTTQVAALHEGGVDAILLETFSHLEEIVLAAGVAAAHGLPVIASFTIGAQGETALGTRADDVVAALDCRADVAAIGLNCGVGPAPLFDVLERLIHLSPKPFVVMPNAGLPKEVDGRMIFMTSPEYFTEYAKRFVELGVKGVGGCCGTTPDHIRVAGKAIRSLSGVRRHIEVLRPSRTQEAADPIPPAERSRFAARLLAGHRVTSVELLPPRSCDLSGFLDKARACCYAGVDAINIPDGPRASARISPMVAAIALKREIGMEPILHYCCRDRNLIGMQSDLLGGYAAGVHNFLIITGDPPKIGDYPDVTGVFDVDAIGLTQVGHNLNHGIDIGGSSLRPPTGIFIGVGANPCAVSPETELDRFRRKVAAGAQYAITQPVFDVAALLQFLDAIEDMDCAIPIVAGVWPLVSARNAAFMRNEVPGVTVPDDVMERMEACRTREDGIKAGIELARTTCDLIRDRVAGFQVSAPFGKVEIALDVLAETP